MSDKLDIVSGMTSFDAIHADGISIGRIASLTTIEVVHREGSIAGYLIQTLSVCYSLFYCILIVEYLKPYKKKNSKHQAPYPHEINLYLIAPNYGLHPTGETQPTESIVEYLIEFQSGGGVISDFHASRQTVEDPIPPQDRVALS